MKEILRSCYENAKELCRNSQAQDILSDKIGGLIENEQTGMEESTWYTGNDGIDDHYKKALAILERGGELVDMQQAVSLMKQASLGMQDCVFYDTMLLIMESVY